MQSSHAVAQNRLRKKFIKMPLVVLAIVSSVLLNCQTSFSQDQSQLGASAATEYQKADAALNKMYKKILVDYKNDLAFIKKLQLAQRSWISFRDAEIEAIFPLADKDNYGSVYSMCRSNWLTKLTTQRTKELKRWIDGAQEGDVCCGSMHIK
jgi:uncharacterized protein YecT (DUF1311 family)